MRHHKELGIPPFLKKTKQIELRLRHKDTLMGYPAIDLTHASCREPVMNPLEGSCQKKSFWKGCRTSCPVTLTRYPFSFWSAVGGLVKSSFIRSKSLKINKKHATLDFFDILLTGDRLEDYAKEKKTFMRDVPSVMISVWDQFWERANKTLWEMFTFVPFLSILKIPLLKVGILYIFVPKAKVGKTSGHYKQ